jgi:hypothetical protein
VTCAGGDAGTRQGHVYADGNESNPCPLSGYLAVDNNGVSGAETGTYTPGANTIVGADGTLPDGSGGAPCGLG